MSDQSSQASSEKQQAYSLELDIDETVAKQRKAIRAKHFHTVRIPTYRLLGLILLIALVYLHDQYILHSLTTAQFRSLAQFLLGYSVLSWLVLLTVYARWPACGFLFLTLDLPVWCVAIFMTGGDQSWLFPVLLNRVADQTNTTFKRVFALLHFAAISYLGTLILFDALQTAVDWPQALTKLAILYTLGFYVSFTALTAEKLRKRTRGVIGVARELICQLAEEKVATQQAVDSKARFLTLISHELRTPLNSILGFSELLEDEVYGDLNRKQKRYVRSIHQGGSRLLRLVEEVLLYADARDDQLALSLSAVDCRQLWSEILDKHELQIAKSGISVQSSGPGMVRADRDKMEKVLSTLLDVSLSLAAPEAKMEIAFSPSSNAVKMSVSVNSVRLEESEFQELQNPFERSSRREGLGLELPLARHIVRAHGGFIEVNTTQDGGLVFEVHLPDGAAADS